MQIINHLHTSIDGVAIRVYNYSKRLDGRSLVRLKMLDGRSLVRLKMLDGRSLVRLKMLGGLGPRSVQLYYDISMCSEWLTLF